MEAVLALAVISMIGVAVMGQIFYGQQTTFFSGDAARATFIAEEAIGILKNIRDDRFSMLDSQKHGLQKISGIWQLIDDPDIVDDYFKREITIEDVDGNRKNITVNVSWPHSALVAGPLPHEVSFTSRFTNWFPSIEDWSQPFIAGDFDFTSGNSGANNHNVLSLVVVNNYLYAGNAQSNGKEFIIIDLSEEPTLAIAGTLNLAGNPNRIAVAENYSYIGSTANTEELQVIDIKDKNSPTLGATFDLTTKNSGADNKQVLALDVSDNTLVMGRGKSAGKEFLVFNIQNPLAPDLIGKMDLSGGAHDLRISGNTVYVATDDANEELQVVDIADLTTPVKVSGLNLDDSMAGTALDFRSSRLYFGRERSTADDAKELASIDISDATPRLLSEFDIGDNNADVNHVSFTSADNLVFLLTTDSAADFRVVEVSASGGLSAFSQLDTEGVPKQADYSPLAKKMFVGGHSNPEIQIIAPKLNF